MPPKKAAPKKTARTAAAEDEAPPPAKASRPDTAAVAAAAVPIASVKGRAVRARVDKAYGGLGQVFQEDGVNWAVNLNQTNVAQNNNKFYIIQLIEHGSQFTCFTHWGRVGEPGDTQRNACGSLDAAKLAFSAKFKDKAANNWDQIRKDPTSFAPKPGKYTMIDIDLEDPSTVATITRNLNPAGGAANHAATRPSALHPRVQDVLKIIFDKDMFKKQLAEMKIDAVKMPLGKLTKAQVEKGYRALEEVDRLIKASSVNTAKLQEAVSVFYTLIPHDFGRSQPVLLRTEEQVKQKFELLNVLADIQTAVAMDAAASAASGADADTELEEHPLDKQYKEIGCGLTFVDPTSEEYRIIDTYTQQTQGFRKCRIVNVLRVDRPEDFARADKFKALGNRRLLWHGTNISVVAAILKTGLRLMPHAGGRVGKGLYFASENGKSAGYVRCEGTCGFMFLNEVILGTPREINQDDSSLTKAKVEKEFMVDSIIARGRTEPDPAADITLPGEWGDITVPQGKPIPQPKWHNSTFSQSEYLVYDEGRVRVKYILQMAF